MGDLAVTVRLRGSVVEDRVVKVSDAVRLGERFEAVVSFPGADLLVVRDEGALLVRGQRLAEGEALRVTLGPVDVTLAHTLTLERLSEQPRYDLRFLLCALLVVALGTWLDAAERWASRHRPAEQSLAAWVEVFRPPPPASSLERAR